RIYRQVLGGGAAARHQSSGAGCTLLRWHDRRAQDLSDGLSARSANDCAGRDRHCRLPPVRRRQGVATIDAYDKGLELNRFELLLHGAFFHSAPKPMFRAIDFFYHRVGNFGLAILLVTLLIKILFLPLANKSYASMAKMKAVQPEMAAIRDRYGD